MNLSEVIGKDKQCYGGFQVLPFAAEGIRQPRESSHAHPYRQVHSLNVAGANQIHIRIADPRLLSGAFEFGRTVARFLWFVTHSQVLNQKGIVHV